MTDRNLLIKEIEYFYIEVVEEFKEAEQQIINDSQFRSLFRKKDYDGNISLLKACKKRAQGIDAKAVHVDPEDETSKEVMERFVRAITGFNGVCDAYVQLQVFLKKKSMKEEAKFSVYKEILKKVEQSRERANEALHRLDLVYTDYTEE